MIFAVSAFAVGCDNYDDRYVDEYASVLRLSAFGENIVEIQASSPETVFDLDVLRSGHNISCDAEATVRAMTTEEWTKYANTYGVQRYYKAPHDCYTIGASSDAGGIVVRFKPDESVMPVEITIFSDKLNAYSETLPPPAYEGAEWANVICLPVLLDVTKGSVLDERKELILRLVYDKNK